MALNFQPPPQQRKKSKTEAFLEPITQGLNGLPALMMQYEQLKRQRELDALAHRKAISEFGTGDPAPINTDYSAQPGTPGATLEPLNSPLNVFGEGQTTDMQETPDQLMARIGTSGITAKAALLNAGKGKDKKNEVPFTLDKSGKAVNALTGEPITKQEPGIDYTFIREGNDSEVLDIRKGNLDIRRDSAIEGMVQKFKADPRVKKAFQSLDAAGDIRNFIDSGNPIAAGAIPTYSARMSGEVGNLSEADKRPFGGSRAILQRIDQSLKQMADGTLTDDNRKFMAEFTDIVNKRSYEKIHSEAVNTSRQKKGFYGMTEKEIYERIYQGPEVNYPPSEPNGGPQSGPKPTMRWNPATKTLEPI